MYAVGGSLADYMDEDHEAWIEASVQRRIGLEWATWIEPGLECATCIEPEEEA